jgi:hypothetical protein
MAGPIALPPVDQRESTARSVLGRETGAAEARPGAAERLLQPVNNVAATSRIKDM